MKTLNRERDSAELHRRLAGLRPRSAARWGRMTAHQTVCHLTDAFRMLTDGRSVRPVAGRLPGPMVKFIALYVPLSWPPGFPTVPELDQAGGGGTRPAEFAGDVAELTRLLDQVAGGGFDAQIVHPIFGRMSRSAWLRWGYLHTDHHLRQFGL